MPDSFGIGMIADRQPRSKRDEHGSASADPHVPSDIEPTPSAPANHTTPSSGPHMGYEEELPEGTLFAVALLANDQPAKPASIREILLRLSQEWSPPDSEFRLADKQI